MTVRPPASPCVLTLRWDLVRIGPDTQMGRSDWSGRLYTLPDHTRRLLADLDDPQPIESIASSCSRFCSTDDWD